MTTNNWRLLPEPLLSRCPPIRLPQLTLSDLTGFAQREGAKRGLSNASIEAIAEVLARHGSQTGHLSLRSVIRLIERATSLEAAPINH
jgi:hypothetical protein